MTRTSVAAWIGCVSFPPPGTVTWRRRMTARRPRSAGCTLETSNTCALREVSGLTR